MENWREDAQPERPDFAGRFGRNAEDENLRETRVLPLSDKPGATAGADTRVADSGPGSLDDRWARLGVFPGGNDRTEVLPETPRRPDPAARAGAAGDARHASGADRPGSFGGRGNASWDVDRTEVLPETSRHPDLAARAGAAGDARHASGADRPGSFAGRGNASWDADRTEVLPETSRRPDPAARAGAAGDGRDPAAQDRTDGVWDTERTTALRIPRPSEARRPSPAPATAPQGPSGPGFPTVARTPARDPWQEEADDSGEATHDPHEVTVQLDSVQIGEGLELRRSQGGPSTGQDAAGPVFVDESGRRSRLYRRIGMAVGLACAGYAVVMVATLLSGNSDAPWMPVPGQENKPAGKVETTPQPADDTDTTPGSGSSFDPDATPSTGAPTEPGPDATAPATGGGTGTGSLPDTDPTPTSPGQNPSQPATGGGSATTEPSAETPVTPSTDPSAPADPDPVSSAPATGGGGEPAGTDDVAGAPAERPVVAADGSAAQPDSSTTPTAPSSENVV
ncbi:hypothetical protein [Streptomyces fungicidicus]|uniref:hypothetical protein n=1 Tax=Streptomyces fungicidicus TaxID=68203 RepID=UPI003689A514